MVGKLIGIILLVAAVWFAVNHVSERKIRVNGEAVEARSIPQHVRDSVQGAHDEAAARREALLRD